jgi:hypothetical protein
MTDAPLPDLPHKPQGDASLLDDLSIRELRVANARLRADVVDAITAPTADRWDALALAGWLWHKRADPTARLERWTELTAGQLANQLGLNDDDQAGEDADAGALAEPAENLEPADQVDDAGEAPADPTVPAP